MINSNRIVKPALDEITSFYQFIGRYNLYGADVLEVGGLAPYDLVLSTGVSSWTSIDPLHETGFEGDKYRRIKGVCSNIPSNDEQYDFIFTANTFEHILDLSNSLAEMHRVLRPGGILFSHYGPIWSAPDGHHIEIEIKGINYFFWEKPILPPWLHLIVSESIMCEILSTKLPFDHAKKISKFCYRSTLLNRLWYENYLEIFENSRFIIDEVTNICEIDYQFNLPNYEHPRVNLYTENDYFQMVKKLYGNNRNYKCRDIMVILRHD